MICMAQMAGLLVLQHETAALSYLGPHKDGRLLCYCQIYWSEYSQVGNWLCPEPQKVYQTSCFLPPGD